jgi:hypothetical protein
VHDELKPLIERWLREYLANPEAQHELRDVAAFGALPLYADVGGRIAIRPDLRVVQIVWARPEQSFFDAPANFRTAALVHASEAHPELRALLPARSPESRTCGNCNGTGHLGDRTICGLCFGLGFLQFP